MSQCWTHVKSREHRKHKNNRVSEHRISHRGNITARVRDEMRPKQRVRASGPAIGGIEMKQDD